MKMTGLLLLIIIIAATVLSCSSKSGSILVTKKTNREKYAEKITAGGGINNPAVKSWLAAGEYVLNYPLGISNNYTDLVLSL